MASPRRRRLLKAFRAGLLKAQGVVESVVEAVAPAEEEAPSPSSNYKKDAVDQVPLNLGINGIVPFLIRGSEQAYTVTRGSITSN